MVQRLRARIAWFLALMVSVLTLGLVEVDRTGRLGAEAGKGAVRPDTAQVDDEG